MDLEQQVLEQASLWTKAPYDEKTIEEVQALIKEGGEELTDSFYKDLDFGTGGLRGVMGPGTNRVNRYTFGMATQGLANYLNQEFTKQTIKVAIAHDSRNNSKAFARQIAEVLAANGIKVFLYEDLRPTPCLSFAIRHLECQSGIVITASHNPPEYNGYKVYWDDGGQLTPPHDKGVINEARKVTPNDIKFDFDPNLIEMIGEKVDHAYLQEVKRLSLTNTGKKDLSIVFTSIHGTSITLMPKALENAGFEKVSIIEEQAVPDGNFPTVVSPNPEEAAALDLAVKKAKEIDADIVIGTDPDADRVGLAVRNLDGEIELINGNQAASVLIYYLLENWKHNGKLDGKQFIASTIVTTNLLDAIAADYGVECPNVLTGFKWIADIIRRKEGELEFIGGGEESYGYMVGDFVRDKDAIASAVILAEAAAWAKSQGLSFYELLINIYLKYGYFQEALVSITKKGKKGAEEISAMMESFRSNTPTEIGGEAIVRMKDYQSSEETDLSTHEKLTIDLPKSNVIQFVTDKGSIVTARPSGTEPKIKFYFSLNQKLANKESFATTKESVMARIELMKKSLGV